MRICSAWSLIPPARTIAFLFLAHFCYAQSDSLVLSSGTVEANQIAPLNLVLTSPAGSEPAAIQFTLTYPANIVNIVSVSPGPTAFAAGKTVACAPASGAYTCVIYGGANATIISNGVVAVVSLTLAASATIGIGSPSAASPAGGAIPLFATDATVTFQATATAPTTVSVTPSSGSGAQSTFALHYSDPLGAADLATVWVWFTSNFNTGSSANSCLLYYARATNQLFLLNDAGTAWSPAAPAAAVTLSNSQCSMFAGAASVVESGTDVIVNLPMTFTVAYAGAQNIYTFAEGSSGNSGWQTMGSWTVPAASAPAPVLSVASTHIGSFTQGQTGATYTVTVSNQLGAAATSGAVTVTDTLPSGLTLTSMSGTGWICTGNACSRSDILNPGASYPVITVTGNVGAAATSPLVNSVSVSGGGSATASATDSTIVQATSTVPATVSVTPGSGSGEQQTFALQYADPLGVLDLSTVWVWFTSNFNSVSSANSCLLFYAGVTNQLFLLNDAGTAFSSAAAPGAAVTLSNSQCSINMAAASVTPSGTNLTLNLPVTFTAGYAGAKSTYMYAAGLTANSGWQAMGTWTVPGTVAAVSAVSVTPSGSSAAQQTFALQYADTLGAADLSAVWVWFTSNFNTVSSANSCIAYYARATNQILLINDAGTAYSSATPGAAVTLSNSNCSINAAAATVTLSGVDMTVNLPVTFAAGFAGAKSIFMFALGSSANGGWQPMGTWTVPLSSSPVPVSTTPVSGSGFSQTFALQYADPLGFTDLTNLWVWFTSTFNTVTSANSCIAYYVRATNQINLINDAGTAILSSAAPGAVVSLSNSQCSINMAAATVTPSGINLPVTFTAGYAGAKGIFMFASGLSANSGWQSMGTWTVP